MPFPLAPLLVAHHLAQKRRKAAAASQAPRQQALAALRASPIHQAMSVPLAHPTALAMPHLVLKPVSIPIGAGAGIKHPTTQELAKAVIKTTATQQEAAQIAALQKLAAQASAMAAKYVAAHPRPDTHAQPDVIAAWLKAGGFAPRPWFPEWGWKVVQKAPLPSFLLDPIGSAVGPVEIGEAVAVVQLGPNDGVVWVEHPSGAWSYNHHWGQDFGQMLSSIASTVVNAVEKGVDDVQKVIAPVTQLARTVLEYAKVAASVVPGLGQVVNEVVSIAEATLDALGGESVLAIALDAVFHAILSSAPGLQALAPLVQPVVDMLGQLLGQSNLTAAVVHTALGEALKEVPDEPSIAGYSPRTLAAALGAWVIQKLGLG